MKSQGFFFYDNRYCKRQLYETKKNNTSAAYSKVPGSVQLDKCEAEHVLEVTPCDTQSPSISYK